MSRPNKTFFSENSISTPYTSGNTMFSDTINNNGSIGNLIVPPRSQLSANLNRVHPIIPSAQQYLLEHKFVSIHSEDRDIIKYPSSGEFSIELPQTIKNVQSVRLGSFSFPCNYSTFSRENANITMVFKLTSPFDPTNGINVLQTAIYYAILSDPTKSFVFDIESGFYTPEQMCTELTNKMNETVSLYIYAWLQLNAPVETQTAFIDSGGYNRFTVVYNQVSSKLWFGNTADGFTLANSSDVYLTNRLNMDICAKTQHVKEYVNWSLMPYLGFTHKDSVAIQDGTQPRFYYGDVSYGDKGYWLQPENDEAQCAYLEAPLKINLMGHAFFYLELDGYNCIDETSVFQEDRFAKHTNETNGVVESAFARIPMCGAPLSQTFDYNTESFKLFSPPQASVRTISLRCRYHDNSPVFFGNFDYAIMLEFISFLPQQEREFSLTVPQT